MKGVQNLLHKLKTKDTHNSFHMILHKLLAYVFNLKDYKIENKTKKTVYFLFRNRKFQRFWMKMILC